jgi:hypothetical protein
VNTLPTSKVAASGGMACNGSNLLNNGGAGTIYLKDNSKANGDVVIDNGNIDASNNSTPLKTLGRGVVSVLTYVSLTSNGAVWMPGVFKGFKLNPNAGQANYFTVTDNNADTLFTDPNDGNMNSVAQVGDTYTGVFALNTLTVSGKAKVYCNEQFSITSDLNLSNASLVTNEIMADRVVLYGSSIVSSKVTSNTLSLRNGSTISHSSASTTSTSKLELNAAEMTIDTTSKIDVSGRGYLGAWQGGNNVYIGRTYGNTTNGGSTNQSGGSYGGLGGVYSGLASLAYGDLTRPNELGSGGGTDYSGSPGGNGGGLAVITAGSLLLDGSILADGAAGSTYGNGGSGGSGGGIRVEADSLSGNGTIYARGGSSQYRAGGGGGRIAVNSGMMTLPQANIGVSGGSAAVSGHEGTIYIH